MLFQDRLIDYVIRPNPIFNDSLYFNEVYTEIKVLRDLDACVAFD